MHLDNLIGRFDLTSKTIINNNKNKLNKIENSIVLKKPETIIKNKKDLFHKNLTKLEILNPLLTLKRGYSITKKNERVISSKNEVKIGDEIIVEFDDGNINAKVI